MKRTVVQIWDFPNVTTQQYDKVIADLTSKGMKNPKGRLYHVASTKPDGGLIVVNVWESREDFEEFRKTLTPITTKYDLPQIQPILYQVHNIIAEKTGKAVS